MYTSGERYIVIGYFIAAIKKYWLPTICKNITAISGNSDLWNISEFHGSDSTGPNNYQVIAVGSFDLIAI